MYPRRVELDDFVPKRRKWHIALKLVPILIGILAFKLILHFVGWEVISLNALFTSLIAATTFLIGFLITGVISDYKESEKLPGEMAASLETMYDEAYILDKNKKMAVTKEFLQFHKAFLVSLNDWFYRKERTRAVLGKLQQMNDYFAQFEPLIQANFLARMKNEQSSLRRMIIRIDTIRDVNFIQSAYAIVETLGFFVVVGLLVMKLEPFYESLFFTELVSFVVLYMIFLIRDLDNPFDYSEHGENGTEVSIKPIHDLTKRIHQDK